MEVQMASLCNHVGYNLEYPYPDSNERRVQI